MSISLHALLAKKTGRPSEEAPPDVVASPIEEELPLHDDSQFINEPIMDEYEEELPAEEFSSDNPGMMLGLESDFRYGDEDEMPGSSTTVGADDDEIFQILGISNSSKHTSLSGKADKEHDIVELFSTIAFLRRENQDLQKEVEFVRCSKDAALKEMQNKLEAQIQNLTKRNAELQERLGQRDRQLSDVGVQQSELDRLRRELEQLATEKEELETNASKTKDDQGSLRGDLLAAKSEINRLKMELGRAKGDNERLAHENDDLKADLKTAKAEMDQNASVKDDHLRQVTQEMKRLEDQLQTLKADNAEKQSLVGKMNEDILALDRNLQIANAQNNDFKQRLAMLDVLDRDLQATRHRMSLVEKENRDLLTEVGSLRNQLQLSSSSSLRTAPPPPPLPSSSHLHHHQGSYNAAPSAAPPMSSSSYATHSSSQYHHGPVTTHPHGESSYHPSPAASSAAPSLSSAASTMSRYSDYTHGSTSDRGQYGYGAGPIGGHAPAPPSTHSRPTSLGGAIGGSSAAKSLSSALGDVDSVRRSLGDVHHQYSPPASAAPRAGRDSIGAVLSGNSGGVGGAGGSSLASLLQSKKQAPASVAAATGRRAPGDSPFATEQTAADIMAGFEEMERELTRCMTEKTSLQDESEK